MTIRGGDDATGAGASFAMSEDAVEAIGTTLDERITCEELAEFVCREVCRTPPRWICCPRTSRPHSTRTSRT